MAGTHPAESPPGGAAPTNAPADLSWPLVERRQNRGAPPGGVERRAGAVRATVTSNTTPLAPFRLAALLACVIRAADGYDDGDWAVIVGTSVVAISTLIAVVSPTPYRDEPRTRLRIVVELAAHTVVVMLTAQWASPLTLALVPTVMLAGFACGVVFATEIAIASAAIVSLQHLQEVGVGEGAQDATLWALLLVLVAITSGLSNRASLESARQQQMAMDRISHLAEANALLFSLQRVAQTMPASLDLTDVLDSTVARVRTMLSPDAIAVLLVRETDRDFDVARSAGFDAPATVGPSELPDVFRRAMAAPKTIRVDAFPDGATGVAPNAGSGLYGALRARGSLVGLIAVESERPSAFGAQDAEILHGLTEPFGIAIDNARLFRRLRTAGADEERIRIARDLHDHIGSSLAMLGFEVDTALAAAERGDAVTDALRHLRGQVSSVLGEVRETLYDLRTEVTDTRDLVGTLAEFLDRVRGRSGLEVVFHHTHSARPPIMQERELWQIAREAITNVERHAQARRLWVTWSYDGAEATLEVRDDGVGIRETRARPDSYGMLGMRERAASIGADLAIGQANPSGTFVRVTIEGTGLGPEGGTTWR